jgi:hypothetical protein
MFARVSCCVIVSAGLLVAAGLWWSDLLGQAGPEPPAAASELAVLPSDCALFVTIRIGDVSGDKLARSLADGSGMFEGIERNVGVPMKEVERYTAFIVAGEGVEIVRTRKPVDSKKLLAGLERQRFYKDKGVEKSQASEKRIGGKTVYFHGPQQRWTTGLCLLDRKVFVRGPLRALEALLGSKVRRSAEMKAMLTQASKHTLVAGLQGKGVRDLFRLEFRRFDEDRKGMDRPDPTQQKEKKDDASIVLPVSLLPYKPLVLMQSALVTLDVSEGYRASARIVFPGKEVPDEGEHALKTLLYVCRELIATASQMDRSLRPLAPLAEPVEKAFRAARIVRKGNTLETSVRLTAVADATVKKVSDEFAAEKKRREESIQKGWKDKPRFVDKDKTFKDKK